MKKVVLFLLVNGIGFGHFKRALVIADAFDKTEYDVRFVVQASATDIFKTRNYPVYAFPLIYSIKLNNSRDVIYKLLDGLIRKLSPSIVFEDTYPEDDYLNIPALYNIPRMLIVRRVDSCHLENLLFEGYFSCYDMLFIMGEKERVISEFGNYAVRTYLDHSEKCQYIGEIFDKASDERKDLIRKKYSLLQYKKNIVFNCGAGGWHIGENICKKIFNDGLNVAEEIVDKHPDIQFIFIAGPYSEWAVQDINKKKNIRVERYEENLSALFQCADICVIRPGYNAVMECLAGDCDVILLPGVSYMEKQTDWCDQLVEKYELCSVRIGDTDELRNAICGCLKVHKRNSERIVSNERLIVGQINEFLKNIECHEKKCMLTLSNFTVPQECFDEICIHDGILYIDGNSFPVINTVRQIDFLEYLGEVVIVYNDENHKYESAQSICNKTDFFSYGIIPIDMYELKYTTYRETLLKFHTMLRKGMNVINISFEKSKDGMEKNFVAYIIDVIENNGIEIISIKQLIQDYIKNRYSYQYNYHYVGIEGLE